MKHPIGGCVALALALSVPCTAAAENTAYLHGQYGTHAGDFQIWYDDDDGYWSLDEPGSWVGITFGGPDSWNVRIGAPSGQDLLPGLYLGAQPTTSTEFAYFSASFNNTGCSDDFGWFEVFEIERNPDTGEIVSLAFDFEHRCGTDVPSVLGQIRYGSTFPIDTSRAPFQLVLYGRPADPVFPQDYVWMHEGLGDVTVLNAEFDRLELEFSETYGPLWQLEFAVPAGEIMSLGEYGGAHVQDLPAQGECPRLLVTRDGVPCDGGEGWFEVHELWFDPQVGLLRFGATFEQYCGDAAESLHGEVRYDSPVDWTQPRFPAYLGINSEPGDPVGEGNTYRLRDNRHHFGTSRFHDDQHFIYRFSAELNDLEAFGLYFAAPNDQELAPGHYQDAVNASNASPDQPIIDIFRNPWGDCSQTSGEFWVYEIEYADDGAILAAAIDFRQLCAGATGELTGQLRYRSDVPTDVVFEADFERRLLMPWSATVRPPSECP